MTASSKTIVYWTLVFTSMKVKILNQNFPIYAIDIVTK